MVVYWKEKERVFGPQKTYRCLTVNDLEEEDVEVIRAGGFFPLPEKDEKGRGIIFSDRTKWNNCKYVMNRVAFYAVHCLLEDIEIQRRGIVMLTAFPSFFAFENYDRKVSNRMTWALRQVLPVHIVGVHLVGSSSVLSLIMPYALYAMGPMMRTKLRVHSGSGKEVVSSLHEYGIHSSAIPRALGGSLQVEMSEWIELRREKESLL